VGNSFGGNGGPNGFGFWVQNGADEIEVTPDGTVIAGVTWDEAGRCAGLYKDGKPNRALLKAEGAKETAWGWNTGNNALAFSGNEIFIANGGKRLLRFRWTPGDLDSAKFVGDTEMPGEAMGLNARGDTLAVVYKDAVELRRASDFGVLRKFEVKEAKDAALAADGSLWVLAGNAIRRYSAAGEASGTPIPGLQKPTALAFDARNPARLIVTDDGPRQQVLVFDVSAAPKLVSTFGEEGGLLSGFTGQVEPEKLFALVGAGTDAKGNLYVGMSYGGGSNGNFFLRSFAPSGKMNWEVYNTAFVDTFGFVPGSDGAGVYSRTASFALDLKRAKPGSEATLRAVTLDHVNHPDDPRLKAGGSVLVRKVEGRQLVYLIGQYAGGYRIYTTDPAKGYTLYEADRIGPKEGEGEQWAWDVDDSGAVWHGDAPGKTIRRYAIKSWTDEDKPVYDWSHPQTWPWPEGWDVIRRIHYDEKTDALYLSGYLKGQYVESWGIIGAAMRRYDGWLKGPKTLRWTMDTPHDGNTDPKEGPLSPSSVYVAGEYLFFGLVKPTNGKQYVHVFRNSDASYVGSFEPGPAVAGKGDGVGVGWLDMPYSLQALRRKNGEYLVLVEEDWRGKNLLYRWTPGDAPAGTAPGGEKKRRRAGR
jgi:hypothetical protein